MNIFSDNPVLEREVRGRLRLRRRGGLGANVWVVRAVGLVALYCYARGLLTLVHATSQDARDLWPLLVYGALALIVLLAPALTANAVTQEREQQTWEILATTRLSGTDILLGKWLGRQMLPALILALLLPLMIVCAFRGHFTGWMLLLTLLFLLLTTAGYSALGLLCSFQAKRTMTATATALSTTALLCLGTVVVNLVLNWLSAAHGNTEWPVLWLNPFYALSSLLNALEPQTFGSSGPEENSAYAAVAYLAGTPALTAAMLYFMISRYRRAVRERN